uniref:Uncharacterized protein n=1 Tax=Heterorhabditis bacteriophora TaxID=37862 RepID=A0A1I7X8U9_HETBA
MNRALLSFTRSSFLKRTLHKGVDSTPPLRFTSNTEKVVLYSFIVVAFLSYPTYVMLNLDNLRPKVNIVNRIFIINESEGENALREDVQAQIDQIRTIRK